jgi:hypothetical protein
MRDTMTGRYSILDHLKRNRVRRGHRLLAGVLALGASLCPALIGASTRVEETDPSVTFSGAWVPDAMGIHSAGAAVVSDQSGARATVSFTGTGITWIGDAGFNRGVARVFLDGTANTVDTYSLVWQDQQALFVAKGLTAGLHSLSIEVTQMRNVNAQASGISVDAFVIENGAAVSSNVIASPGYIEQNNPAVTYSGNWYLNMGSRASGGSAVLAVDPGTRASVLFNGTGITWIGFRDQWSVWARVSVDGVLKTTLDAFYLPMGDEALDDIWQRPMFSITDLPNGPHTLMIEVLGQKDPDSGGAWIWIDAFRVFGPAVTAP